jgi:hypothetical protein
LFMRRHGLLSILASKKGNNNNINNNNNRQGEKIRRFAPTRPKRKRKPRLSRPTPSSPSISVSQTPPARILFPRRSALYIPTKTTGMATSTLPLTPSGPCGQGPLPGPPLAWHRERHICTWPVSPLRPRGLMASV